eukprot:TRINITY_DN5552_c0_g1_i1.p1 TRINITY_DN5552_c0_g1~~TRINITY_DN5552_c0_g1_i1.p1  ORF type:complete len:408 (-),score=42.07 TRINITY_DN5552_c0_g1_i1:122-1345(-)
MSSPIIRFITNAINAVIQNAKKAHFFQSNKNITSIEFVMLNILQIQKISGVTLGYLEATKELKNRQNNAVKTFATNIIISQVVNNVFLLFFLAMIKFIQLLCSYQYNQVQKDTDYPNALLCISIILFQEKDTNHPNALLQSITSAEETCSIFWSFSTTSSFELLSSQEKPTITAVSPKAISSLSNLMLLLPSFSRISFDFDSISSKFVEGDSGIIFTLISASAIVLFWKFDLQRFPYYLFIYLSHKNLYCSGRDILHSYYFRPQFLQMVIISFIQLKVDDKKRRMDNNYLELLEFISKNSGVSVEELGRKVEAKQAKLAGLISKEGAAQIIAAELHISFDKQTIKISQVVPGMRKINLVGRIITLFPVKEYNKNGRSGRIGSFILADETSNIRTCLLYTSPSPRDQA